MWLPPHHYTYALSRFLDQSPDLTVLVRDGQVFCHKPVLACHSYFLKDVLLPSDTDVLALPDFGKEEITNLIQVLYGQVSEISVSKQLLETLGIDVQKMQYNPGNLGRKQENVDVVDPIHNVQRAAKPQKVEGDKLSEISGTENEEEYVEREIKEECFKLEIKAERIKPEIEDECIKLETKEECTKTEIKVECLKPVIEKEYLRPERKEREIKEECFKLEIKPERIKPEIEDECIKVETKEECTKTEIIVECLKPVIEKEYLRPERKECAKIKIIKEKSKSAETHGLETEEEYIEPENNEEFLKLESKEECIKNEIQEVDIKLEVDEMYINPEMKDKFSNPELKKEYIKLEVKKEYAELIDNTNTRHEREVKDLLHDVFSFDVNAKPEVLHIYEGKNRLKLKGETKQGALVKEKLDQCNALKCQHLHKVSKGTTPASQVIAFPPILLGQIDKSELKDRHPTTWLTQRSKKMKYSPPIYQIFNQTKRFRRSMFETKVKVTVTPGVIQYYSGKASNKKAAKYNCSMTAFAHITKQLSPDPPPSTAPAVKPPAVPPTTAVLITAVAPTIAPTTPVRPTTQTLIPKSSQSPGTNLSASPKTVPTASVAPVVKVNLLKRPASAADSTPPIDQASESTKARGSSAKKDEEKSRRQKARGRSRSRSRRKSSSSSSDSEDDKRKKKRGSSDSSDDRRRKSSNRRSKRSRIRSGTLRKKRKSISFERSRRSSSFERSRRRDRSSSGEARKKKYRSRSYERRRSRSYDRKESTYEKSYSYDKKERISERRDYDKESRGKPSQPRNNSPVFSEADPPPKRDYYDRRHSGDYGYDYKKSGSGHYDDKYSRRDYDKHESRDKYDKRSYDKSAPYDKRDYDCWDYESGRDYGSYDKRDYDGRDKYERGSKYEKGYPNEYYDDKYGEGSGYKSGRKYSESYKY